MADKNKLILDISARLDELNAEVAKARGELKGLKGGVNSVDDTIKKGAKDWSKSMAQFGLAIQGVKQAMAILDRTFGSAVKTMAKFQTSMLEVNTLLGLTEGQFKNLNNQVISLSKRIPQTADQLSKGLYQVVSAGVDAGDAMAFLETASKGAVAGLTDTRTSVDAITSVINAYGMEASEAEKVSDIFFQTVKLGKTTFAELAPTLGQVIPIASAFGVKFEEVAGAFATLTKSGIPTARAATSVGRAINEIVKPASKAEVALKKLGFTSGQSAISQLGLQGVIGKLSESGENMASVFGDEALRAVLGLGNNAEDTTADLEAMNTAMGATTEAFNIMNNGIENQSLLLKNQLDAVYLRMTNFLLPSWTEAIKDLNNAMDQNGAINKVLDEATQNEIDKTEARITAIDLLSAEYEKAGKSLFDQDQFLKFHNEELNRLGLGTKKASDLQLTFNIANQEAIDLAEKVVRLKGEESKAIEEKNKKKAEEIKLEKEKLEATIKSEQAEIDKKKAEDQAEKDAKAEKEIKKQEKLKDRQIANEWARVDRLRELGTISTTDYILELQKRRDAETTSAEQKISLEAQLEQLGIERFARLQQGWKAFLKGELIDFITAKQIEMLATLGTIWAEGGATLGTSLTVALPMYGTGIAILEGAKQAITAFAEGGRIDSPTLALMGEAGAEFVAPEANFEKYSKETLTPMIQGQVEAKLMRDGGNGMLAGGLAGVQKSVDRLTEMVSSPVSVISGTQIKLINARMNRGSLVR